MAADRGRARAVHKSFRFEGYTLDVTRGCLRAEDRGIELRPKSFGVLLYLVENAGRLVPKDEVMKAVWPDVVVTDESLAKCVSEVRLALGDREQRLLKTVPRRGYLFDAPVRLTGMEPEAEVERATAAEPAAVADVPAAQSRSGAGAAKRRLPAPWLAVLLVLAAVAIAAFVWRGTADPSAPDRPSVAVLPFANMGDPALDYFSDGITGDLITSLGKFAGLFVIGRDSAFTYKGRHVAAKQIGRELGARYLVEGTVRRDGETVRITAELVDAASDAQLWAQSYDRELTGIFAVQDEVTRKIVETLVAHVTQSELNRALSKPPESLAAYDYYLQGMALIKTRHGPSRNAMVAEARRLFDKAVAADPRYAPAVQGLAYTYAAAFLESAHYAPFQQEYRQPATLDHAAALARHALELDPYLADAHATLAWILHWQYRRSEGIAEFERALELNPNLADGRFAHMLAHDGRAAEAVEFMQRVMRHDPFPPPIYLSYLGNAYYLTGRYEKALETLRMAGQRMPGYRPVPVWLAATEAQLGRQEEARLAVAEVLRVTPDFTIAAWLRHIRFEKQADADRLSAGLRKAGLPE